MIRTLCAALVLLAAAAADAKPPIWDKQIDGPKRFKVLKAFADLAVLDGETGLVWARAPAIGDTWVGARLACESTLIGDRYGWRLPRIEELASLFVASWVLPEGHPFANLEKGQLWSATTASQLDRSAGGLRAHDPDLGRNRDDGQGPPGARPVRPRPARARRRSSPARASRGTLAGCPSCPDVTVYVEALERARRRARRSSACALASPFAAAHGRAAARGARRAARRGRRGGSASAIVLALEGELFLVLHLMIAGRLHWKERGAPVRAKSALAAFDFPHGTLMLTEAEHKKRASLHVVARRGGARGARPRRHRGARRRPRRVRARRSRARTTR